MVMTKPNKQGNKRGRDEDEDITPQKKKIMKKQEEEESFDEDEEDDDEDFSEEEDDSQEDADDDDQEDDDEEEDESAEDEQEEKPKAAPQKKPAQTASKPNANAKNWTGPELINVTNGNAVLVTNLNKTIIGESFQNFLGSKSGVKDLETCVIYRPCAIVFTKDKKDAEKIVQSCQGALYMGHQMQLCNIASGVLPRSLQERNTPETIDASCQMIVYSLVGPVFKEDIEKLCPKAKNVEKGRQGIYVSFDNTDDAKEAFILLNKKRELRNKRIFVKYVRNNSTLACHTGKEIRFCLYNVPFNSPEKEIKELAPKAIWFHQNPSVAGSYHFMFADPKSCLEAGTRLHGYNMNGRALKVWYQQDDVWDIKINAQNPVNDAKDAFKKLFPEVHEVKVMSWVDRRERKPQFVLVFKSREEWERALPKAITLRSVSGQAVKLGNFTMVPKMEQKSDNKPQNNNKKEQSKPQNKPAPKAKVEKVQEEDSDEDDDEDESNEAMDTDEEGDSGEPDLDEDDDDEEDEESEEEQKPPMKKPAPKPQQNGFANKKPPFNKGPASKKPNFNQKPQSFNNKKPFQHQKGGKFNPKFKK